MEKTDFKKRDKAYYTGKAGRFDVLDVPVMAFLTLSGQGDPNTSRDYARSVAALYGLSYGLKFHGKKAVNQDHVVPPLEAVWWADNLRSFTEGAKDDWQWKLLIRQPDWVDQAALGDVRTAFIAKNAKKKDAPTDTDTLQAVTLDHITEGLCVQVLHVGPYDEEGPVLAEMHRNFIPQNGLKMTGKHHEIYLSDPRKVVPEKLRTVLRQPVSRRSDQPV